MYKTNRFVIDYIKILIIDINYIFTGKGKIIKPLLK